MSRFSKAEAEKAGWAFVHEQEGTSVITSGTQGERRESPGLYRAERYVSLPGTSSKLVSEVAETEGLLLERIHAYEQHLKNTEAEPYSDIGQTREGPYTLAPNPIPGEEEREARNREAENDRTAEPYQGETERVLKTSKRNTGEEFIGRPGEEDLEDVDERKELEAADAETERVLAGQKAAEENKAYESGELDKTPEESDVSSGESQHDVSENQPQGDVSGDSEDAPKKRRFGLGKDKS